MSANIHASCVSLAGKGVLLLGASGTGKSDLTLRLIDDGATLVADDRCELFVRAGSLWARAPASIAGLIELRGIGIIAMPRVQSTRVTLAAQLGPEPSRLPQPGFYAPPAVLKARPVPLIRINGLAASAPARVRAVLAALARKGFRDTFNPERK